HRTAHSLGLYTNATMLYGHVETPAERIGHFIALRELQAESLERMGREQGNEGVREQENEGAARASSPSFPHSLTPSFPHSLPSRACFNCVIPLSFIPEQSE